MKIFSARLAIIFILLTAIGACGKDGGGSGGACSEPAMAVTTTPANNSTEAPAAGTTFPVSVNITSNLPASGATIEIKARPEAGTTAFYTESKLATSALNNFTVTNTPLGTPAIVEITITSKSCATNKWTGSFRYSRK
jgi:hypothetical protein